MRPASFDTVADVLAESVALYDGTPPNPNAAGMMSESMQGTLAFEKGPWCVHSLSYSLGGIDLRLHTARSHDLPAGSDRIQRGGFVGARAQPPPSAVGTLAAIALRAWVTRNRDRVMG